MREKHIPTSHIRDIIKNKKFFVKRTLMNDRSIDGCKSYWREDVIEEEHKVDGGKINGIKYLGFARDR
ncbi:hypothetical protein WN48_00640 [Eufriesea mexicana]|uniref:Uncharacterized protein n=1 Tax=Eufriesea mexicana TaxID=516756 RepID=A0A310SGD7_9HYME|nr:hypothetical protein WN48_00640 [Eufriesea mexicana]